LTCAYFSDQAIAAGDFGKSLAPLEVGLPLVHASNSGLLLKILAYVAIGQHLVSKSPVLC